MNLEENTRFQDQNRASVVQLTKSACNTIRDSEVVEKKG